MIFDYKTTGDAPFFRTPYNYDTDKESQLTGLLCEDESLAQQQFKEDSDINTIVNRFLSTGNLPENPNPPVYADFDEIFDFQGAHQVVIDANARFMAFPAHLRARFHNDPQELLEFVENVNNKDEAKKLGLLRPDAVVPSLPSPPTVPLSTPPATP